VHVLGIDLAAQPESTGVVALEPLTTGRWRARQPAVAPDDEVLVDLGAAADIVGVDAPLGWPVPFVDAVGAHARAEPWPGSADRRPLTHRCTDDVVVRNGWGRPMSASADRLGSVAMRAALLQRDWAVCWGAPAARDGSGRLAETYPAAALRIWGLPAQGYKSGGARRSAAGELRHTIVDAIAERTSAWLDLDQVGAAAVRSDHGLDALICALVAAAVAAGATVAPGHGHEADRALIEGWIHVPTVALETLRPPG
jgi:predicted nuclease with RNAse H fold